MELKLPAKDFTAFKEIAIAREDLDGRSQQELIISDLNLRKAIISLIANISSLDYQTRLNNLRWADHYLKQLMKNFIHT